MLLFDEVYYEGKLRNHLFFRGQVDRVDIRLIDYLDQNKVFIHDRRTKLDCLTNVSIWSYKGPNRIIEIILTSSRQKCNNQKILFIVESKNNIEFVKSLYDDKIQLSKSYVYISIADSFF